VGGVVGEEREAGCGDIYVASRRYLEVGVGRILVFLEGWMGLGCGGVESGDAI